MTVLYTAPIYTRDLFGVLLRDLGLVGDAVEVGTHRGGFAQRLLQRWPGRKLYCVDPWANPPGFEEQARYLSEGGGQDRMADFKAALRSLKPFVGRVTLLQRLSCQAVNMFGDGSLDFVYLDGDHEPPHPAEDIARWWPKVKPGGVLAGHDFVYPGAHGRPDDWGRHIQPAVLGFAERYALDLALIVEPENMPWSWYVVKPGSVGLSGGV